MVTTPIKELAAARKKLAQPERTIETELPQELSRLPAPHGFSDVNSLLKDGTSATNGGRIKAGHRKKATAVPQTRQRTVITATGFTDEGHPTILSARG